ncbi:PspC domain-containing protein [Dysgonomonas sp. Marseille-P4677]|uniref:PspC domain-containing protein n=1 Tax=Dysgonomonas sp. Marseille-P4677 TaxID=2364790 RepID=UPI0019120FA8|nr:PspC domain-containing protein [Dysgonomonas sp. Marseille-P4677]MBK5722211.1 PspC domain-containing protein [Dysgonomonas sp. Marseille-P4677]
MKPTIRVSIGGLAFNLEEDAYQVLENYLRALRKHFMGNVEADEIIADIELRLSELLQMRVSGIDAVVSVEDALEITKIMGNPKDFDNSEADTTDEEGAPKKSYSQSSFGGDDASQDFFKKKLYRDESNKILGGVCSGLGHYFKIDPIAIRIFIAGIIFLFSFISFKIVATIILTYVVLWVVMPAAKTFKQKISMAGADPSIENIENRSQPVSREYKGSAIGTILGVFLNIIVAIVAVVTSLVIAGIIISFIWFYQDTEVFGLANYLVLLGYNTLNFKIALILAVIIPIAGFLRLMIKVLKRSSFTSSTLVSFVVGLIIWIGALCYLGNRSVKFAYSHRDQETSVENVLLDTTSDTLYVELGSQYLAAEPQPNNPAVFYRGDKLKERQVCILPKVRIEEDTSLTNYKVEILKKNFGKNYVYAKRKLASQRLDYAITDSLIVLNPAWYDNANPWNMETFEMVISAPSNKQVIVNTPLNDSYFINHFRFSDYDYCGYHYNFDFD